MKIKDIMISDVISVRSGDSVTEVADILFKNGFHGLPVLENDKVAGIITEDDFFLKNFDDLFLPSYIRFIKENKIAGNIPFDIKEKIQKLLNAKAADIMTIDCLTVTPDMDAADLMNMIRKTKYTTFPVVDYGKKILGIVTLSDILGTVKRGSKEMERAMKKNGRANELSKIAGELSAVWSDKLVIMSKKKIRTWKGMVVVAAAAVLGAVLLAIVNANLNNNCGLENKTVYPLECQRFTYSDWSACQPDGTQVRGVLEKIPQNCEGRAPELVRPCSP